MKYVQNFEFIVFGHERNKERNLQIGSAFENLFVDCIWISLTVFETESGEKTKP